MIERLPRSPSAADLRALAALLVDAVESGAAVSFRAPLALDEAEAWWRSLIADSPVNAVILVARDGDRIDGTVQLQPAWAPNQPHRADLVKLLVHRRAQGRGLGTALMRAAEDAARAAGFTLLTLDAKAGTPADRLYRSLGWTALGVVPRYALDPDGTPHDAVMFYKHLDGAP